MYYDLQGGGMLVRWEILLVRWAKYLSVGAENFSVGLPFCCLFISGISKKKKSSFFPET
jgi:hypothetical protein